MLLKCLVIVASAWSVAWACRGESDSNEPPTIKCPSIGGPFIADKKHTYTRVTWNTPERSDPEGKPLNMKLTSGKASGSVFSQGTHTVTYVVTDEGGLTAHCSFSFAVVVKKCQPVTYLKNGRPQCLPGYKYGDDCTFTCDEGHQLKGASRIECQKNEQWTHPLPQCVALDCPELSIPKMGIGFHCTNKRKYKSVCMLQCDEDKGYAPARGQSTQCTKDQVWTNIAMMCEDVEKPVIQNCPLQTVLQTKDPASVHTKVIWPKKITVKDNSNETIVLKSDSSIVSASEGTFPKGYTPVKFTATDSAGNDAVPCFFNVHVQAVECDPPHMDDDNIEILPCSNFVEGRECQLDCYLALKLIGSNFITCKKKTTGKMVEGYWDWGQSKNKSAIQPYCRVHNCPKLRAPNNGALACDDWLKGEQCTIMCDDEYDIPVTESIITLLYLCSFGTGKWKNDHVPDCVYREYGETMRMPQIYYFRGGCAAAKLEIKTKFLEAIEEHGACPQKKYCVVKNVNVVCGDEVDDFRKKRSSRRSRRRRRRRQYIYYQIEVVSRRSGSFSAIVNEHKDLSKRIEERVRSLTFRVGQRLIRALRVKSSTPVPVCPQGHKIGMFHKDSCAPCLTGSYHNISRDECMACPLGQYQERLGQITCDSCPEGQTTITVANTNQSACTEMCKPGYYSKNGVVPCDKCPHGTYQTQQNGRTCTNCPVGQTTEKDGSSESSQCIPYDILIQGPVNVPVEGNTLKEVCDFTFALWIKLVDAVSGDIKFRIYSPITKIGLEVAISTSVKVYIGRKTRVFAKDVVKSEWTHVAVLWSSKTVTVYVGGNIVRKRRLSRAPACPSPASSVMMVSVRDHAYMYLRDLNFLNKAEPSRIKEMTKSCNSYLSESLFTLEDMDINNIIKVTEVIPSTCLRPDVCAMKPCGKNVCIPRIGNFTCVCRGGYTGNNCEIPPDLCKDNVCSNNATCIIAGLSYTCDCQPGFRGVACEERIADGGWSKWMEWSDCSTTCGKGTKIRHRFCTNPPPDREGKDCQGDKIQTAECQQVTCPECDISTLVVGKGITKTCETKGESITCSVKCELGKVFPEKPFDYICTMGMWEPSQQTVSCTDPVSPYTAGINYTVVFDSSLTSHEQVQNRLNMVGSSFKCVASGACNVNVGSSACSSHVKVCEEHDGHYYGSLIIERSVPEGEIDVRDIQQSSEEFLSPLFNTWNVFTHTSEEVTPDHRALEMSINSNKLTVYPYGRPSLAIEVPGQFGTIMKAWKNLDDTNWEVRNESYIDFNIAVGRLTRRSPNFLSARQIMTCPFGSVQGGIFCIKCPPGKKYNDNQCHRCRHGYYQDKAGMDVCEVCPGFQTTKLLGSPTQDQCIESEVSGMKMLMGMSKSGFGMFDLKRVTFSYIPLSISSGNIDYLAYSTKDGFVYFVTQSPVDIGRIKLDGTNEERIAELPPDTQVSGLDVDVATGLIFFTTYNGELTVLHSTSHAMLVLLSNLTKPRDLHLDQDFGIYWVESDTIQYVNYSSKVARAVITDEYAVWNPVFNKYDKKLLWQSYNRLRTADLNGSGIQTLVTKFTSRFGSTKDYFFHIESDGRLIRVNKDLSASGSIYSFPQNVVRMRMIDSTPDSNNDNLCSKTRSDCDQGCFPLSSSSRQCFCALDYTLQKDYKTCRQDFLATLVTSDATTWEKPTSVDYSVPPSKTLRFKVKACHSSRLALAESKRRIYRVELAERRGNVTEISIRKISPQAPPVVLVYKEKDFGDCSNFKTFWISWKESRLRLGVGEKIGKRQILVAADNRPYIVNFVMFGVGINSTATWQF